jgi:hypothetical protein
LFKSKSKNQAFFTIPWHLMMNLCCWSLRQIVQNNCVYDRIYIPKFALFKTSPSLQSTFMANYDCCPHSALLVLKNRFNNLFHKKKPICTLVDSYLFSLNPTLAHHALSCLLLCSTPPSTPLFPFPFKFISYPLIESESFDLISFFFLFNPGLDVWKLGRGLIVVHGCRTLLL